MEMIDVEKQDMIRGTARAEVRTAGPLCEAGWWWGDRGFCALARWALGRAPGGGQEEVIWLPRF